MATVVGKPLTNAGSGPGSSKATARQSDEIVITRSVIRVRAVSRARPVISTTSRRLPGCTRVDKRTGNSRKSVRFEVSSQSRRSAALVSQLEQLAFEAVSDIFSGGGEHSEPDETRKRPSA